MRFDEFDAHLSGALQMLPAGSVADLTDDLTAWWDGTRTVYASATTHPVEFPLAKNWDQFHDWLGAWLKDPRFSVGRS
jgi:hypothetical protein